jgi:hypothetical protein
VEVYLHSPNTPSWRGAQVGGAEGQLYMTMKVVHRFTISGVSFFLAAALFKAEFLHPYVNS